MLKYILIFLIFTFGQTITFGQLNFDISKVKGKTKSHFKKYRKTSKNSTFETVSIFYSKNKYEICLSAFYGPNGGFAEYKLYSNGEEWKAIKWESDFVNLYDTTINKYKKLKPNNWDTVLNKLNELSIFLLPNQITLERKTRKECSVFDGAMYSISFKIGKRFRIYSFDNPDICANKFKDILEYKKYNEIVDIFYNSFKE